MKGIVLAGGLGTRLLPFTKVINKHLLPVYNRPMIFFPIRTLKRMGFSDILIVTGGENIGSFTELLGDGSMYGVNITYRVQLNAGGIAEALQSAEGFVGDEVFPVILGDNFFYKTPKTHDSPTIVLARSKTPERFGVFQDGAIIEKPKNPTSNAIVSGLYWYDKQVFNVIKTLKPSERGELEITDVNNWYLEHGAEVEYYDGEWSDMGTIDTLYETAKRYAG